MRGLLIESAFYAGDADNGGALLSVSRTVYDANGRPTYSVDAHDPNLANPPADYPRGSRIIYDSLGRVVRSERLESVDIGIVDDPSHTGFKISELDSAGSVLIASETDYDAASRVVETRSGVPTDLLTTNYEYDAAGRQSAVIGPEVYDPELDDDVRVRTEFEYNAVGAQTLVRDRIRVLPDESLNTDAQRETRFEYDAAGRLEKTIFADGTSVQTVYDALGRREAAIGQLGQRTDFEYDEQGRLEAVILPAVDDPYNPGQQVHPRYEYEYDPYGNRSIIRDNVAQLPDETIRTDHDGDQQDDTRETTFAHDHLGRQVARTLPLGERETFEYDDNGRTSRHTSFEDRISDYTYDSLGRLIQVDYFLPTSDPDVDPADETISYVYDTLDRLTEVLHVAADSTVYVDSTYSYDAVGYLTTVSTLQGTIDYEYDALGQLTRTWTGTDEQDPYSDTQYEYDSLGRLIEVEVHARFGEALTVAEVTVYRWDAFHQLNSIDHPSGMTTEFSYDILGRTTLVEQIDTNPATPETIATYTYTLRDDGRRAQVVETRYDAGAQSTYTSTFNWTYDAANRLTQETLDSDDPDLTDYTADYTFDLVGNRLTKAVDLGSDSSVDETYSYQYDDNDRLLVETLDRATGVDTQTAYTYNATEQTGKTVEDITDPQNAVTLSVTTNAYNLQGRLAESRIETYTGGQLSRVEEAEFIYNESGVRTSKFTRVDEDGDQTFETETRTDYLVDQNNLTGFTQVLEETETDLSTSTVTVRKHYTVGFAILAQTTKDEVASTTNIHELLKDAHGSVRLIADVTATIVAAYTYDAYGNRLDSSTTVTNIQYTGEQFDSTLGNYYLRARYYDPVSGRFNRLDPFAGAALDPQSLHKYLFTHGDPINSIDPLGLSSIGEMGAVVGVITIMLAILLPAVSDVAFEASDLAKRQEKYFRSLDAEAGLSDANNTDLYRSIPYADAYETEFIVDHFYEHGAQQNRMHADFKKSEAAYYWTIGALVTAAAIALDVVTAGAGSAARHADDLIVSEARGGVYLLRDVETGQVMRTGRTNDLLRRRGEHFRDPLLKDYRFEPVYRTDVYAERRGLEANLDWIHNPPLNYDRPIDPNNPNLQRYLQSANEYLDRNP